MDFKLFRCYDNSDASLASQVDLKCFDAAVFNKYRNSAEILNGFIYNMRNHRKDLREHSVVHFCGDPYRAVYILTNGLKNKEWSLFHLSFRLTLFITKPIQDLADKLDFNEYNDNLFIVYAPGHSLTGCLGAYMDNMKFRNSLQPYCINQMDDYIINPDEYPIEKIIQIERSGDRLSTYNLIKQHYPRYLVKDNNWLQHYLNGDDMNSIIHREYKTIDNAHE